MAIGRQCSYISRRLVQHIKFVSDWDSVKIDAHSYGSSKSNGSFIASQKKSRRTFPFDVLHDRMFKKLIIVDKMCIKQEEHANQSVHYRDNSVLYCIISTLGKHYD